MNDTQLKLAEDFFIPTDAVTQTFAILAIRGAGKTHTASVLAEEFLKHDLPFVVLDPVGVWWGLRLRGDGTPYHPIIIMGGEYGDLPLTVDMGEKIARVIASHHTQIVIDLSQFSKNERHRFVTDFAETLYRFNRDVLHVFMDESDQFVPQSPLPEQRRMMGAIDDMVRLGRNRGIGVTLISQRAAKINKDVLTQCEVLVALRTIGKRDRDALDDWIEANGTPEQRKEMMDTIGSLENGQAWVWSPTWLKTFRLVQIRQRETLASSSTPKVGERRERLSMESVDVAWLAQALGTDVPVEGEKDDTRKLREQIARLESDFSALKSKLDSVENLMSQVAGWGTNIVRETRRWMEYAPVEVGNGQMSIKSSELSLFSIPLDKAEADPVLEQAWRQVSGEPEEEGTNRLNKPETKIVETLFRYHPFRFSHYRLALASGYSHKSSSFVGALYSLRNRGLIVKDEDDYFLDAAGLDYMGGKPEPKTKAEMRQMWLDVLPTAEKNVYKVILDAFPAALSVETISEITGYSLKSSSFVGALYNLRNHGLVDRNPQGFYFVPPVWFD